MKIEKFASKVDMLGILGFMYIIIYSIIVLRGEFRVISLILLLIGIGGFCVDFFIVYNSYRKWK